MASLGRYGYMRGREDLVMIAGKKCVRRVN